VRAVGATLDAGVSYNVFLRRRRKTL